MSEPNEKIVIERVDVRTWRPKDQGAVDNLFENGRLAGTVAPNDTAFDIEVISDAYLSNDRSHFWVAEYEGRIIGMVGVAEEERNRAEIRRLRVDPSHLNQGIAQKLMEVALNFCNHHGYLKVVLDTHFESGSAMDLFDRFSFQHNRNKTINGKELVEFYLDLYHDRKPKSENNGGH